MKKFADIFAVAGAIIGSTLIALNLNVTVLGYIFFLISALSSVYLLKITNGPKSLIILNTFFVCVNIFGIFRYM